MTTIAILNHKGGVGKTTTAINLGAALQQAGKKVLLVDLDGQANLTEALGISIDLPQNNYTALRGDSELPLISLPNGLTVAPSSLDLSAADIELLNEPGREVLLSNLLESIQEHHDFDYVIVDCPPYLGLLTLNALTAANTVIIPVQAQYLAMRGMAKLLSVIEKVRRRMNKKLTIGGLLVTQYNSHKVLNKSVAEMIREDALSHVYATVIRENIALAEAPALGKTIFESAPRSNGANDYASLAQEILNAQ